MRILWIVEAMDINNVKIIKLPGINNIIIMDRALHQPGFRKLILVSVFCY